LIAVLASTALISSLLAAETVAPFRDREPAPVSFQVPLVGLWTAFLAASVSVHEPDVGDWRPSVLLLEGVALAGVLGVSLLAPAFSAAGLAPSLPWTFSRRAFRRRSLAFCAASSATERTGSVFSSFFVSAALGFSAGAALGAAALAAAAAATAFPTGD
jgi:hypothetical protein